MYELYRPVPNWAFPSLGRKESCRIWRSRVRCEHMNESDQVWTCEWGMSQMKVWTVNTTKSSAFQREPCTSRKIESFDVRMSHATYECIMSRMNVCINTTESSRMYQHYSIKPVPKGALPSLGRSSKYLSSARRVSPVSPTLPACVYAKEREWVYVCVWECICYYGVAAISMLLKIIGLLCKRDLLKRRSAKETYNFKEPTNRSHSICLPPCLPVRERERGVCVCMFVSMCLSALPLSVSPCLSVFEKERESVWAWLWVHFPSVSLLACLWERERACACVIMCV